MMLLIYVDDIILTRNDHQLCEDFKTYLDNCFYLKDLSTRKYFLETQARRNKDRFCVSENML